MAINEYEFSQGFVQVRTSTTSTSISFTSEMVNFTWSVQSDVPVNFGHFPGSSSFDAFVPTTTATVPTGNATWVLTANSPGQNIFSRSATTIPMFDAHLEFFEVRGIWTVQFVATSLSTDQTFQVGTSALTPGGNNIFTSFNASLNPVGRFTEIRFSTSPSAIDSKLLEIDELNTNMSCFCAGTLIATPEGAKAVETLNEGDVVLTADGGETVVHWLGRQFVDTRRLHPVASNPICIQKGALGRGLPENDLWVSGDHGIALDGHLINAAALVNGTTIRQVVDMPVAGFTYYHVETERHELILAEGVAAESYLDVPSRDAFDNGQDSDETRKIEAMDMPRVSTRRLLPAHIRKWIEDQAPRRAG